jgi:PAS domain S-box-containing protein
MQNRTCDEPPRRADPCFRDAADHVSDIVAFHDCDGYIRYLNQTGLNKLGVRLDEILGRRDDDILPADITRAYLPALRLACESGMPQTIDISVPFGFDMRTYQMRFLPQRDGLQRVTGVVSVAHDVTADRKAEKSLRASEARLQLALEAGEMGAWQWHLREERVTWWPGMAAIHGLAPDAAPSSMQDYARLIHPDDRAHVVRAVGDALRQRKDHRIEYRIVRPDGGTRWMEGRGKLTLDGDGTPLEMSGICMDITQRKRTEQDLRFMAQASDELAALVDHQTTLDRIAWLAVPTFADWCTIDLLDGNGVLQRVAVAHVDPAKIEIAHLLRRRFPADPNASSGLWNILRTGRAELIAEITDALLERTISDPEHLRMLRELGLRSYISAPLTTRGKTFGVVSFVTAESARIYGADDLALAEELARRAAISIENANLYRALRDADHRKDVFLATLAHELRNPLAPIANALGIARLGGYDYRRAGEALKLIERQTGHLTRLVDDLLDIARISTGKIELHKTDTDLTAILQSAVEISRPQIDAGGHALTLHLPHGPTALHADPVRLAQVFANLLNNAAKYTDRGGALSVCVDRTPQEFIVSVRDNGIGMSSETLRNVFAEFAQGAHLPGRAQGGLGIGLSLVEGLVKLHGGTVEAQSGGAGHGSTFTVRLPRTDGKVGAPLGGDSAGADGEAPHRRKRILVVDDNIDAALTVAEILQLFGHEVEVVHDGPMAVSRAATQMPEVVLLDIGLPGIDGYEVARRIRTQPGGAGATLIALTGWGQERDKQAAAAAGFDQHWVKPVDFDKLRGLSA